MRRRFIARDPYWTTAKFNSTCACGQAIQRGARIFYYPSSRKAVCEDPCGRNGSNDLENERQYESLHSVGGFNPYD